MKKIILGLITLNSISAFGATVKSVDEGQLHLVNKKIQLDESDIETCKNNFSDNHFGSHSGCRLNISTVDDVEFVSSSTTGVVRRGYSVEPVRDRNEGLVLVFTGENGSSLKRDDGLKALESFRYYLEGNPIEIKVMRVIRNP